MSIDPKILDDAVAFLKKKKHIGPRSNLEDVMETLSERSPFDDLDDQELEAVALAALKALASSAPPAPAPKPVASSQRGGRPQGGAVRAWPDIPAAAPFRFVVLPEEVASPEQQVALDEPLKDGFCATLTVDWAAETPLLIGATAERGDDAAKGKRAPPVKPMRLGLGGSHIIPGATIRGALRSATEIVALGKLGAANLHHRYGLRDFEHPAYGRGAMPVSQVDEVHAGWLHWEGSRTSRQWFITPAQEWAHISIDQMLDSGLVGRTRLTREQWIDQKLDAKYIAAGMFENGLFDFRKTVAVGPPVPDETGRKISAPRGGRTGTLVFAGKLPKGKGEGGNKKFEYVFFDAPSAEPQLLGEETVATFIRLNSKPSRNKPVPDGSFAALEKTLEAGRRVPVFYVGRLEGSQGRDFAFGLTRLFKVPHERCVGDVLGSQPRHAPWRNASPTHYAPDFVENLFGFVLEPDDIGLGFGDRVSPQAAALKGRVSCSHAALLPQTPARELQSIATVMMAPRASYAPFYLRSEAEKDYSAATQPKLAGRKRYLPRRTPDMAFAAAQTQMQTQLTEQIRRLEATGKGVSADIQSDLIFLAPAKDAELTFRGAIRLHNVTAAELGAVLFALTHGGDPAKPYRHMIGRARPFGAGQMRIAALRLAVEPNAGESDLVRAPDADEVLRREGLEGFVPAPASGEAAGANASLRPFLDAFAKHMRKTAPLYPRIPVVQEFLGACDPRSTAAIPPAELSYMELKQFNEIRRAVKPLKEDAKTRQARAPASYAKARDGRLLPAPIKKDAKFWT
ncbi:RAMP superfamily CRISPR-associated protein [Xanthobacter sp. AM11]|uniref:RAMP superfamily CRISPR-associated protein n=1 Tax=Xanthobacter sp. AM11 TaxID=3380643 RepID=UPI0039BEDD98